MAVAADQLIGNSLGFSILPKDTKTYRPEQSNHQLSDNKTLALLPEPQPIKITIYTKKVLHIHIIYKTDPWRAQSIPTYKRFIWLEVLKSSSTWTASNNYSY